MTNVEFTSDVVRSATFREKLKGYNPEDVHAFMERSASAIDQLTARLGEASARALKAEAALASNSEADESVRRTLVLAQRTAEMAVREANDEAVAIRSEARREADQLIDGARAHAAEVEADASRRAAAMTGEAERLHADADAHATATVTDADTYTERVRAEADARAAAILADAEVRASARIADAEASAAAVDATVEAEFATRRAEILEEIEQFASANRQETEEAIAALRAQHRQLWADVEALGAYLATERARILETLRDSVDRFGDTLTPAERPDVAPPEPAIHDDAHAGIGAPEVGDAVERHDEVGYGWSDHGVRSDDLGQLEPGEDGFAGEYDRDGHVAVAQQTGDVYGWTRGPTGWVAESDPVLAGPQGALGEKNPWGHHDLLDGAPTDEGYQTWTDPGEWGQEPAVPPAWDPSGARPAAGWADAAAFRPEDETAGGAWSQPHDVEPEPAWGQPIESGYQPGWAPEAHTTEPAWEWPGRADSDTQADPGPAAAWFGQESAGGEHAGVPAGGAGWSTDAWDNANAPGDAAEAPEWGAGAPAEAEGAAAWGSTAPTAWTGWSDVPGADAEAARDPWEGIEPVESTWTEEPAADEQSPPSRLLFTLGDEARADGSSSPAPEPETTKQRRTLLGRLKG